MAKVLWAADRRVTKDDGTLATSGTLTIRLADTSTPAVAYTDRTLSTEQSVFNIGSDGFLSGRSTIYGADDVGYDAYVQSTGVNGGAWTIPDLSIAQTSASDVTDSAAAFKNLISNGAFDLWGSTTSWSNISGDNDGDETALGWFFAQPSAASNEVSRQTASRTGASYGLRFGRPNGSSSANKLRLWGMLATEAAIRARGQVVTISFNAHQGANFSGGSLAIKIATGTAAGEDGDNIESGGFTGHATPLSTAQSLDTATARYEFQATIGSNVSELGFQFAYTPAGTASANDWVQIEDVQIEIAGEATAFVSTPEPVSYLIQKLSAYGRALLALTATAGDVTYATGVDAASAAPSTSFGRSTWNVADAAALRTLAELGTAALATVGTSGDALGKLNANKTDSGNNTFSGANTFSAANLFSAAFDMANTIAINLRESGGTARAAVQMSGANVVTFGNASNATSILGSAISTAVRPTFNGNTALDTANGAALAGATFTGAVTLSYANSRFTVQNTSGTGSLLRLGADSGVVWLGAVNNQDMYVVTNGVECARFKADGDTQLTKFDSVTALSTTSAGVRGFGAIRTKTTAFTFALIDAGQLVQLDSVTTSRIATIPTNASVAFPIGNTVIPVENINTGTMVLTPDTGVTLLNEEGASGSITLNQHHGGVLYKNGTNTWRYRGSRA